MAAHLATATESTRRAYRTALQAVAGFAAFMVAVAIPPVADALNGLLALVGVGPVITPALVGAIGAVGAALIALVTKLQNVYEGRDQMKTPAEWAEHAAELELLVSQLLKATHDAGVEVRPVLEKAGWVVHELDDKGDAPV